MKTKLTTKLLSLLLVAFMLVPILTTAIPVLAADETTYVLNGDNLQPVSQGSKADGDTDTAGTDNFFTIHYSAKTKIDGSKKDFEDGFHVEQRINFGGKIDLSSDKPKNCLSFTTQGAATVKIWWVSGGVDREFGIYDTTGALVTQTKAAPTASNLLFISELTIPSEGTYYLGGIENNNYIFKVAVTTATLDKGPRADWSTVAAPTIASITTTEEGKLSVTVNGLVDHNGADYLTVDLIQNGQVVSTAKSTSVKSEHTLLFSPIASDDYDVVATLFREGETSKVSSTHSYSYKLPLEAPYITNVSNLGNGETLVIWNPVREAESYKVSVNGGAEETVTNRQITLAGLATGTNTIQITAISGTRSTAAEPVEFNVTANAERGWNYTIYGPSAKPDNNSLTLNDDGSVTLKSIENGGKLQPTGADGLGFYYTAIPADQNFTFRVNVHVDSWVITNGQEGFGLMVTDHVPSADYYAGDFWTNQYQVGSTKIEYRYESDDEGNPILYTTASGEGTKYSMKLGIGTISKIGINQDILDRTALGETGLIVGQTGYLKSVMQTLEWNAPIYASKDIVTSGNVYNIIGNYLGEKPQGTLEERFLITDMVLEIQKNNTGYFVAYYDMDGNLIRQIKNYEHDALEAFDSEYVYLGVFTARYATATFSDMSLTLIDEKDDAPAEERPLEYIAPTITVTSSNVIASTSDKLEYQLIADTNVDGVIELRINGNMLISSQPIKKYVRLTQTFDITEIAKYGENSISVSFIADANQEMEPYTALKTIYAQPYEDVLTIYKGAYHCKTIYASPNGVYNNNGTREMPYDILTAINSAIPGQTIVLMEGTYQLMTGLRIQRGMNGTEENPIRMIADPDAKTRPVIDFMHQGTGITHGADWWYFYGFDVTNTLDSYKGFQVSGNNNVLDNINTYNNGNTGIQISRYHVADLYKEQWPANNLILNCTSYGNADKGFEDADGFAAKLTIGEGNVFDGCIAYNNADDGWDLYAKVATGPIGAVVIKNCIAYGNGYLEDGTLAGNGNGFKLGGDSLSGKHQLINCIAFNNKQKGIDSNSCPDIIVENCISYNNCSYNVAFYTNSAADTDFSATGIISFKDENAAIIHKDHVAINPSKTDPLVGENLKPKGNQDTTKYRGNTNYYWFGSTSVNSDGDLITADIFVSLEFKGFTRNEDGSINRHGFLELNEKAPANAGVTNDFTPSAVINLLPDEEHNYSEEWTSDDYVVHWQECECGFKANVGKHVFKTIVDKEATETTPGSKHQECLICGFKLPSMEIPALGSSNTEAPSGILGFFVMIWTWIVNFFKSIFGR